MGELSGPLNSLAPIIVNLCFISVALWDYLDVAAIQTVTFIATLVVRYTLIVSLLLIIATYAQGDVFEFCTKWSAVATGWIVNISWAALTMVFALRAWVIWAKARPAGILFGVLWLITVGLWTAVNIQSTTQSCDQAEGPYPDRSWVSSNWAAAALFDTVIIVAILVRFFKLSYEGPLNHSSRLMRNFIVKSNLAYFLLALVGNTASFVCNIALKDGGYAALSQIPTYCILSIAAARMVFATQTFASKRHDTDPHATDRNYYPYPYTTGFEATGFEDVGRSYATNAGAGAGGGGGAGAGAGTCAGAGTGAGVRSESQRRILSPTTFRTGTTTDTTPVTTPGDEMENGEALELTETQSVGRKVEPNQMEDGIEYQEDIDKL